MLSGLARFRSTIPEYFFGPVPYRNHYDLFPPGYLKAQFRIGAVRIRIGSRGMFVYTP